MAHVDVGIRGVSQGVQRQSSGNEIDFPFSWLLMILLFPFLKSRKNK